MPTARPAGESRKSAANIAAVPIAERIQSINSAFKGLPSTITSTDNASIPIISIIKCSDCTAVTRRYIKLLAKPQIIGVSFVK